MDKDFEKTRPAALSRRGLLAGAGVAGAAAVAVTVLPQAKHVAVAAADTTKTALADEGGYQASPHVLHYYRTARV